MTGGDYDDSLNVIRNTTSNRLILAILFSFLTVAGSGSVAIGDLLVAPNSTVARNWQQVRKFWTKDTVFNGNKVFQRDDLIDIALKDSRGRTNLQRMQKGLAPIGPDGKSINLHHLIQTSDGAIAEVTQTMHQQYSKALHIFDNTVPSGIDRTAFDAWRRAYWKNRALGFLE